MVFLNFDWQSTIKSNLSILSFEKFILAAKKCHHLKPKYFKPRFKFLTSIYIENSEDENVFYSFDSDLKIKWPIKKPIISKKDRNNITFKEYKKF